MSKEKEFTDAKTAHYTEHLEQENAQLKQQLAEKDGIIIELEVRCKTIIKEKYELVEENEELKQQLADLQNDHDRLIDDFQEERKQLCSQIKQHSDARKRAVEKIKTLRYEICEKIKNIVNEYCMYDYDLMGWHLTEEKLENLLEEIKRGK